MDKLLRLLSDNSSYTTSELSMLLGESEDAIKERVADYEKQGIIKGYRAVIDWSKVADSGPDAGVMAIIELKVTPQKEKGFDEIAERVMAFEEVSSVSLMAGTYDLGLTVKGDTIQDVSSFVSRKLSTMEGVLSTATHFFLKRYKYDGTVLTDTAVDERCMQF